MTGSYHHETIQGKLRQAAGQYQCAVIMRCWFSFGAVTLAAVIATTAMLYAALSLGFSWAWPIGFFILIEAVAAGYFLVYRMRTPPTAEQIALYIEEHHPELESRLISAVSFDSGKTEGASPWLLERFFEESSQQLKPASVSDLFDADAVVKLVLINGGFAFASLLVVLLSWSVWLPRFEAAPPQTEKPALAPIVEFSVDPGDIRVRVGESQTIVCRAEGEESAQILWRTGDQPWQTTAMQASLTPSVFHHRFESIQETFDYQVQVSERRSRIYTVTTWLPPAIDSLDAFYDYPDYISLDDKSSPNIGGISAIEGTQIVLEAHVNTDLESVVAEFENGERLTFVPSSDRVWQASFTVVQDDELSFTLTDFNGETNEYDFRYEIEALDDQPPDIRIEFPQRDFEVVMLDEVPFRFRVSDDYALSGYGLQYEIAGQDAVRIALSDENERPREADGEYVLMLEELNVAPGDLITWTVWAEDEKSGRQTYETLGDPYFLEVRPFKRFFRESMTNAQGGQQQQQQQQQQGGVDAEQKDVVIAIWNLRRKAPTLSEENYNREREIIIETQQQIQETMRQEAMQGDPTLIADLFEAMQQTVDSMTMSSVDEHETHLAEALDAAQRAYRLILKMKPDETEVQQRMASQMGGGGGGGAQDGNRPEIDELDLDRSRNFYEEERRTQQTLDQNNDAVNRIKELTQRQQLLNEEIAKLISEMENAEDPEELKRRLERLEEEARRNLERLDEAERSISSGDMRDETTREALQRLQEARQRMNQGLEELEEGRLQEARASGSQALDSLQDMEDGLQQLSRGAAGEQMQALQNRFDELVEREQELIDRMNQLQDEQQSPDLSTITDQEDDKRELLEQKRELADDFIDLMNQAGELEQRAEESQELMSRRLGDWLRETSQSGILEQMQNEQRVPLIRMGVWDRAIEREEDIRNQLADAAENLRDAAGSAVENELEGMQMALNELQDVIEQTAPQPQASPQSAGDASDATSTANAMGPGQSQDGEQAGSGDETQAQPGQPSSGISQPSENSQSGQQGQSQQPDQQQGQGQGQSQQPGQQQGQGQGQGQSQQPGQQQGQGQGQSQQPGQQQGQGQGQGQSQQPGQQQGQGQGQGQSQQPGQQQGQGNSGSIAERGGPGSPRNGGGGGGPQDGSFWGWDGDIRSEEAMRRFLGEDGRNWLESIGTAERLLPEGDSLRDRLTRLREEVEEMRQVERDPFSVPKYDVYVESVAEPLVETARLLDDEIKRRLDQAEFAITVDGAVPAQYERMTADYFKALAESEAASQP